MADEEKVVLEREYIVPLRRKFIKTPKYKRVPKAVKALKQFIVRHMKVEERDLGKVKIDKYLNEELWFRGIGKPAHKIKVKCKKFESGIVKIELAELPEKLKFKKEREEKVGKEVEKKKEEVKQEKKEETTEEEKKEEVEKGKSTVEAGLKEQGEKAKEVRHEVKLKNEPKHKFRQALQK